jgi:predicted SprT family Zn-dependent metalloprotease
MVISLNPIMVTKNTLERCKETILHEIAHAIVGCVNGHNEVWKAQMVRMGLKPDRCWNYGNTIGTERYKYHAICPTCQQKYKLHKIRSNTTYSCPKDKTRLSFVENQEYRMERSTTKLEKKLGIAAETLRTMLNIEIDF